jgi:hypothetical protein
MFGQKDINAEKLDKDPMGPWIVAPIVRPTNFGEAPEGSELLGFISADSHQRNPMLPGIGPKSIHGRSCFNAGLWTSYGAISRASNSQRVFVVINVEERVNRKQAGCNIAR